MAARLERYAHTPETIVLALPRGGVPVGYEIALALGAPLDIFQVRKLGAPGQPELAMGAIGSGGGLSLNEHVLAALGISRDDVMAVAAKELQELERRETLYRDDRPRPQLGGKTVILADDGLATGASMRAAVAALRMGAPGQVIVAIPVAPLTACVALRAEADDVECLMTPPSFFAVGSWYDDFRQVGDDEVRELLRLAAAREPPFGSPRA